MTMDFGQNIRQCKQLEQSFADFVKMYAKERAVQGDEIKAGLLAEFPPLLLFLPDLICSSAFSRKFLEFPNERNINTTSHESITIVKCLLCKLLQNIVMTGWFAENVATEATFCHIFQNRWFKTPLEWYGVLRRACTRILHKEEGVFSLCIAKS